MRIAACAFLALATLALCCLCPQPASARSTHPIFTNRPKQYASKYINAIEPLQGFLITHSHDAKPLAGFHPDAPAIPKPEAKSNATPRFATKKARVAKRVFKLQRANDDYSATAAITEEDLTVSNETDLEEGEEEAEEEEECVMEHEHTHEDLDHWCVNGAPHSYHKGQAQLYPDRIQLQFTAFGKLIELEMHIIRDLYNEHSVMTVMDGDQLVSTHKHVLQSYWATLSDGSGWATATLHRNGKFQAIVHRDGDTIQVDPVEIHKQEMDEKQYTRLHRAAHHHSLGHRHVQKGMVVHRHSDMKDTSQTHRSGSVRADGNDISNNTKIHEEPIAPYTATSRRLLQVGAITNGYGAFPTTTTGIVGWTNCWIGDTTPQKMSIGFAVDAGMYAVWGSVEGVQQYLAWQLSVANLVYLTQLHVFLTISDIIVASTVSATAPAWNDFPPYTGGKCPIPIATKLNTLSTWRGSSQATRNSVWSLQTNCYPPSGIVGIAWIGVLCNTYYGVSISTYTSNQWLTTAHELGHNFGAQHTFQNGQGYTGSIMDYGDGTLNGIYQFYTKYSQADMCSTMAITKYMPSLAPYCVAPYAATCGNGVLEPGEACDDTTACCNQPGTTTPCQLKSTSQCSGETPCCTGCQWKPSSTTCMNGNGYCQNGFCAASPCTGYSGMTYCGTVSTNPCRQQCKSAGVCSSSYTSPNLNVPDGMVCATAPYSTCLSGVCVASGSALAPVVTYSWSTAVWSTCSCLGSQNRAAYCLGSDGSVGTSGVQCTVASRPSLAQSCTIPSTCVTYSWSVSAWSTCSVDCGGGLQSATVQCIASTTLAAVADSTCTATKPASTQACSSQACPTAFVYSAWSACSVGCGGGVSTRTVTCQLTQNSVVQTVASSYCSGLLATSQTCNTVACVAPTPTVTYSLTYGTWGTCSVTCGSGAQSRPAYCLGSDGKTYATSLCGCGTGTSTAVCPSTIQACNTGTCPSYAWSTPAWSACSLVCGGGIQTRNVVCMNTATNVAVSNSNCVLAQPAGVQSCNTAACAVYKWTSGLWLPCSKMCGTGTQTRAVACVDANNIVALDSLCTASTKPVTSQACNLQSCPVYGWLTGTWATCSAWCDGGTQTRSVKCAALGSLSGVSFSNCDTSNIPTTAQYCNMDVQCPKNSTTQWVLSDWSDCSQICGGDGIQNRTVICTNSTTGLEVDIKYCPVDYIPEISTVCGNITCPTYWYTSSWSGCSSVCDGGSQTRTVECRYVNATTQIDNTMCTGTQPSLTADCNLFPCPSWVAQSWGDCSTRCGDGVQVRQVDCITWDNQNTTADMCSTAAIPITSQTCSNAPCPHWHRGPWSYCDAPCGGGNQTRSLVCQMPDDDVWLGQIVADDTLCPPVGSGDSGDGIGDSLVTAGKPASWELCNQLPCPTYYWDVVKWSDCSASCGGGTQTGSVVCRAASTGDVATDGLCLGDNGDAPASSRTCNTDPCPVYAWKATQDWANCSVVCGTGTQTRPVYCVNTAPAAWLDVSFEITTDETNCAGQTKLATIQACAYDKSVCFANGGVSTNTPNGMCSTDGTCLCRAGFAGTYCQDSPKITNVLTNGPSFTAGIPFGDTLQVTWQSTGSLPYVSILLTRTHAADATVNWPIASYIAKDVVNTGTYSWSIGEGLSDLESGDGFAVAVWFSNTIWAESSSPFIIADPCDYKSCGIYGTCGVGGVCECVTGYSGDSCSLGPCERAHCSTSYGSCNNDDYIGKAGVTSTTVGECLCGQGANGYFDGLQCRTPPGCTPKCLNGGDLFNVIIDLNGMTSEALGQCGVCGCQNMWSGDDCDTCGITCHNGGVSDSTCNSCDCTAATGYFGNTCACKYYSMVLRLDMLSTSVAPITWIGDSVSNARFARTLAIDIALASGQVTGINVQINVVSLALDPSKTTSILATVQFGLECPMLSQEVMGSGGSSMDTETAKILRGIVSKASATEGQAFNGLLSPATVKNARYSAFYPLKAAVEASGTAGPATGDVTVEIVNGRPGLLSVYNIVATMFEDLSSPIYRGVVTSTVSLGAVVSVKDLTGQDTPRVPGVATDPFLAQQSSGGSGGGGGGTTPGSSSSSRSLSTGAIVGIVIGCVVVLAFLSFLLLACLRKDRRKTSIKSPLSRQHQPIEGGTELASSQHVTPADTPTITPHTTPPAATRSIQPQPAPPRAEGHQYAASPSAPLDVEHIDIDHPVESGQDLAHGADDQKMEPTFHEDV